MEQPSQDRIVSLDLIRGVAVLGILAVNIAGFAGPTAATLTPHLPQAGTHTDELAFAVTFVLFEGKMRALFSMLFGASMLLFIARANASGGFGELLQLRRLGWLMLFGMAHYFLFWWGDILFVYALAGIIALFMYDLRIRSLLVAALVIFASWHLTGTVLTLPDVAAEEHVRTGTATHAEAQAYTQLHGQWLEKAQGELVEYRSGFTRQAAAKLVERPLQLLEMAFSSMGETLPLMLIGMALYRTGFFAGAWPRKRMLQLAGWGSGIGLMLTLAILGWLWPRHFPIQAMYSALVYWTALPHLLMALGYAAMLVLTAPALARTALGQRLIAAGRVAFSNYLGTTVLMTAIFYGWGLGLIGHVPQAMQPLFVVLGWALMLAWPKPWLAHFRQGPLEWLWRSLTEARLLPMRRG